MNIYDEVIAHWERLLLCETVEDYKKEGFRAKSCAFCAKYIDCVKCPIRNKTGKLNCEDTPYQTASFTIIHMHKDRRKYIQKELDFLKVMKEESLWTRLSFSRLKTKIGRYFKS